MNLAHLLSRAGRGWREAPAIAVGAKVWATYGELARRCAVLAGALRGRFGLSAGDRVALIQHNGPAYLETLCAAWYAGLVAVPVNAKLHPRGHAYILQHSGARLCVASADLAAGLAPHLSGLESLREVIEVDSPAHRKLFAGEPAGIAARAPGRSRLAVLHQRHHRAAQGRHAQPPQPHDHDAVLLRRPWTR